MTTPQEGGVLVTGAAGGIGRATVCELSERGLLVFAGVRHIDERDPVLAQGRVIQVPLDVTDRSTVEAAARTVEQRLDGLPLRAVVNNAATMVTGPLETVSVDAVRSQFEVNVLGVLNVVQAFVPQLRRSAGRIINIGSTSGRVSGRFVGPYAASKASLESLTATLRLELADVPVAVAIIEPGVVGTTLWDREMNAHDEWAAGLPGDVQERFSERLAQRRHKLATLKSEGMDPGVVAGVVADAILSPHPKPRYIVGRRARLLVAVARTLPERALIRIST